MRACVHYAMFEDEYYLKSQIEVLRKTVYLFLDKSHGSPDLTKIG